MTVSGNININNGYDIEAQGYETQGYETQGYETIEKEYGYETQDQEGYDTQGYETIEKEYSSS